MLDATWVESSRRELFLDLVESWKHSHKPFEGAKVLEHFHLLKKIVEVKAPFLEPACGLGGLFLVEMFSNLLDHRDGVPHVEDPPGHAVWMKFVQLIQLFSFTNILDWAPRDCPHGESSATSCVTIKLGQDDATKADCFIKGLGDLHCLLACCRICNKEGFTRLEEGVELLKFFNEAIIYFLSTSGIKDDAGS